MRKQLFCEMSLAKALEVVAATELDRVGHVGAKSIAMRLTVRHDGGEIDIEASTIRIDLVNGGSATE
jgi:hypothetical protein